MMLSLCVRSSPLRRVSSFTIVKTATTRFWSDTICNTSNSHNSSTPTPPPPPTTTIIQHRSFASKTATASAASSSSSSSASSSELLQRQKWSSYLATGRGSQDLFGSIDHDQDGKLSPTDVRNFLLNIEHTGVVQKALKLLDQRAADHPLTFVEFQEWLVASTQDIVEACIREHYETSPHVGDRRSMTLKQQTQQQQEAAGMQQKTKKKDKIDKDLHLEYSWNASTMSQALRRMQYAVRGEIVMAAEKLAAAGREIIYTNIGNPQAVDQPPITYYRQVLALCDLPAECGVDHPDISKLFPTDVVERAKELRAKIGPGGTGSYTHSQGIAGFRKDVADFIAARDGHPAFQGDIFLTNGASSGIEYILESLISCDKDAIMIPIPQYPIYSALITRLGGHKIGYQLDEDIGWGVTREELYKRLDEARARGLNTKGLALINPGNPTGQVMSRRDLETVCRFCADNDIVLLADEVYQRNVYSPDKKFISTKKVAVETAGCGNLQLVSFHSTSKGLIGECGRRGGYMEMHHIDPYVHSQIYKLASSGLCSGTAGQIMTSLMVKGPTPGSESYDLFVEEETKIFDGLKKRSKALVDGLNRIDGISCQPAEGAMYAFPKVELPQKALEEAERNGQTPDTLYALSLLEETGICVVPASGFGQKEGRIGFRTTFLPKDEQLFRAIDEFGRHHKLFCEKYS